VKCDEQRPECGQCVRTGRRCQLSEGVFRHHEFSSSGPSWSQQQPETLQTSAEPQIPSTAIEEAAVTEQPSPGEQPRDMSVHLLGNLDSVHDTAPHHDDQPFETPGVGVSHFPTETMLPPARPYEPDPHVLSPGLATTVSSVGTHTIPVGIPAHSEESFFLRIFCEGPAKW
jgi:hypothetical protein